MKFLTNLSEALDAPDLPDEDRWEPELVQKFCETCDINVKVPDIWDPYCPRCNNQGLGPPRAQRGFRIIPDLNEAMDAPDLPDEDRWRRGEPPVNLSKMGFLNSFIEELADIREEYEEYDRRSIRDQLRNVKRVMALYPDFDAMIEVHNQIYGFDCILSDPGEPVTPDHDLLYDQVKRGIDEIPR